MKTKLLQAAIAATIAFSFVAPAHAYQCKTYPTQAVGISKFKHKARVKARKGWSNVVKGQLGQAWTVWQIAQNKHLSCAKINTNSGKKWRCLASAKPCLYVVQ